MIITFPIILDFGRSTFSDWSISSSFKPTESPFEVHKTTIWSFLFTKLLSWLINNLVIDNQGLNGWFQQEKKYTIHEVYKAAHIWINYIYIFTHTHTILYETPMNPHETSLNPIKFHKASWHPMIQPEKNHLTRLVASYWAPNLMRWTAPHTWGIRRRLLHVIHVIHVIQVAIIMYNSTRRISYY